MRDDVQKFLREKINEALAQCTERQRYLFRQMYRGEAESVPVEKLEWALSQCERTLIKNGRGNNP